LTLAGAKRDGGKLDRIQIVTMFASALIGMLYRRKA